MSAFRRNFSWMLVGTWAYAAGQWLAMVALARLGSPAIVGRFALGQSIASPLMKFSGLQLRMMLATDVRDRYRFGDFLTLRVLGSGVAVAGTLAIGVLLGHGRETLIIVAAVALVKWVEEVGDIVYGLLQKNGAMRSISISQSLKAALGLAALVVVLWATSGAFLGIAAMGLAAGAVLLGYDLPRARAMEISSAAPAHQVTASERAEPREARLRGLLRRGWPLGVIVGINSLAPNIPRYAIEASWGEAELGIFSALAVVMRISFYFETALAQTVLPDFARLVAGRDFDRIARTLAKFSAALAVLIVVMVAAVYLRGSDLMRLAFGPEYAGHESALAVLTLASGVGSLAGFFKSAVDAMGHYSSQIPILVASTSASAVASVLLVPSLGILGGALALLASRVALLLGYAAALAVFGRRPVPGLEA